MASDKYSDASQKFIDIYTKLKNEHDFEVRGRLLEETRKLKDIFL